jgi:Zn-finger nucleic acid-binding protein
MKFNKEHPNTELVPEGERKCPICDDAMETHKENGVSIDVCKEHGVWTDVGEIEKIIGRATRRSRASERHVISRARSDGKLKGAFFGWWSFLLD